MSFLNQAGLGVHNFYGPRTTRAPKGGIKTEGSIMELSLDIWADSFNNNDELYNVVKLPKGALIIDAYARVSEAFALGGTTPTITVGTKGSETTNGLALDEADAEAVGVYKFESADLKGTWASPLADDTEVNFVLGGTTPTVGADGKVRFTIRYVKLGVAPDAAAGAPGQGS